MHHKDKGPVKGSVLNIRLTPENKFALEILARKQHRSVTSVMERGIMLALTESGISQKGKNWSCAIISI